MMSISLFPEPADFELKVRQKGLRFLKTTPKPTSQEWSRHSYWQDILPEMRGLYNRLCNYCATWIPHSTGQHSVDHFLDKDNNPQKAYEWNNYRYVSTRFNSRKGVQAIVDPASLPSQAFILNFTNFFVETNPVLTPVTLASLARETIRILKFNEDDELVEERMTYFRAYQNGDISFDYLQNRAPFIAFEINRQGLRTR